ncbi:pogo transposable element with KRAB domain [Rhizophagus clarus]|uniref:Pogo transposable element with KRAB domain n=1 Tax=Rhizophagus clarus TaxID=94130 RepID=A0A8H3LM23_9GLOM|nr:pogo transposable element with KRAB domain [Rhizophagus clarus]
MDETPVSFDLPTNTTVDELDGTKLPLLIIFKLKNIPRGNFPPGVIIRTNQKGWMNENEMLFWIENVWVKRVSAKKKTDIAVISGGLISRLQPLDISVNKSFKSKMRRRYNEWIAETIKDLTPTGIIKRPTYETVAHWVKDSWEAVDVNLI